MYICSMSFFSTDFELEEFYFLCCLSIHVNEALICSNGPVFAEIQNSTVEVIKGCNLNRLAN